MSVVDKLDHLKLDDPLRERLATVEDKLARGASKEAQQEKLSVLVLADKYEAASNFLGTLNASDFPQQAAYVYYQTGKLEALRKLAALSSDPVLKLCLSQAEYKAGHFDAAFSALANVEVSEDEVYDLNVNKMAIFAQKGVESDFDVPLYDRYFNHAYAQLVRGQYALALENLELAKQEAPEDERDTIALQSAYAYGQLGQTAKALELLSETSGRDLLEQNNALVLDPPKTLEDVIRSLELFSRPSKYLRDEDTLFA